MQQRAFEILGIEPTTDGRVIRSAFVRLARIYHPDRFVGQPADVRAEAERRMKEVVTAYESLRAAKKSAAARVQPPSNKRKKDPWEEVRRAREAVMARRLEQERSRARWMLWEELERQARERATYEAQQASFWIADDGATVKLPEPDESSTPVPSALARRLAEARNGSPDSLAPQR
jgi:curved DNA-binding protein CbpA